MFVGVDHLIKQTKAMKGVVEKNIILLSNLEGETDTGQMDEVVKSLQKAEVNLNILGLGIPPKEELNADADNLPGPSNRKTFSAKMRERVAAFAQILEALDGVSFTFE